MRDTGEGWELDISLVMLSNLGFEAVWLLGSHITLAVAHAFQAGGDFFFRDETVPSGPGPSHYQDFTMTPRHTTHGRTPLDE